MRQQKLPSGATQLLLASKAAPAGQVIADGEVRINEEGLDALPPNPSGSKVVELNLAIFEPFCGPIIVSPFPGGAGDDAIAGFGLPAGARSDLAGRARDPGCAVTRESFNIDSPSSAISYA